MKETGLSSPKSVTTHRIVSKVSSSTFCIISSHFSELDLHSLEYECDYSVNTFCMGKCAHCDNNSPAVHVTRITEAMDSNRDVTIINAACNHISAVNNFWHILEKGNLKPIVNTFCRV